MHEFLPSSCTASTQALSVTNPLGPRDPKATKSPRDQENSFFSEKYNLHMDKKCSSRWLLVCVQRVATLIKRHDNFIYTKKSNIINSSWCYLFYLLFFVPPKFCISFVFDFYQGNCKSQEKLKTMLMQNFGGTTKSIMVFLKKAQTLSRFSTP